MPGHGWPVSSREESARRSIYVHVKRSLAVPILANHDAPDTDASCPVRYTTTVPSQALCMLNGEFPNEQAALMAAWLRREYTDGLSSQIRRVIRLTTSRDPGATELATDVSWVNSLRRDSRLSDEAALEQYCLLALNTNAFLYLD
jgi:hypothetical protein